MKSSKLCQIPAGGKAKQLYELILILDKNMMNNKLSGPCSDVGVFPGTASFGFYWPQSSHRGYISKFVSH